MWIDPAVIGVLTTDDDLAVDRTPERELEEITPVDEHRIAADHPGWS